MEVGKGQVWDLFGAQPVQDLPMGRVRRGKREILNFCHEQ